MDQRVLRSRFVKPWTWPRLVDARLLLVAAFRTRRPPSRAGLQWRLGGHGRPRGSRGAGADARRAPRRGGRCGRGVRGTPRRPGGSVLLDVAIARDMDLIVVMRGLRNVGGAALSPRRGAEQAVPPRALQRVDRPYGLALSRRRSAVGEAWRSLRLGKEALLSASRRTRRVAVTRPDREERFGRNCCPFSSGRSDVGRPGVVQPDATPLDRRRTTEPRRPGPPTPAPPPSRSARRSPRALATSPRPWRVPALTAAG